MADFAFPNSSSGFDSARYHNNGESLNLDYSNTTPSRHEGSYRVDTNHRELQTQSLRYHERHDSILENSPSTTPKAVFSPQQENAQPQPPPSAQMTPHSYPQRPVNMSRSISQYSNHSAGYAQDRKRQQRSSFSHDSRLSSNMSRSSTQQSTGSIGYQERLNHDGSQPSQSHENHNCFYPEPASIPWSSQTAERNYTSNLMSSAIPGWHDAGINHLRQNWGTRESNVNKLFSQSSTSPVMLSYPASSSPMENRPYPDFGDNSPMENYLPLNVLPEAQSLGKPHTSATSTLPQSPVCRSESPRSPPAKQRRRRSTNSSSSSNDPVVGQVTFSGKFRCTNSDCADLSFGRQADFRRHYDDKHAPQKVEYFCRFDGCVRSRKPHGKSKGRSFGHRKDKMEEHVRNVHHKTILKRKRSIEEIFESEDESSDEQTRNNKKTVA